MRGDKSYYLIIMKQSECWTEMIMKWMQHESVIKWRQLRCLWDQFSRVLFQHRWLLTKFRTKNGIILITQYKRFRFLSSFEKKSHKLKMKWHATERRVIAIFIYLCCFKRICPFLPTHKSFLREVMKVLFLSFL